MEYVNLGNTGLRVSKLAFGTMSFGGDADASEAERMYRRCREAGVNFFDCANVYNGGEAERILGGLCKSERDDVVLTTKAYYPVGDGANDRGLSRLHITRELERSLKRLQTDRIDVFFLHHWDAKTPIEETLRAVEDLTRAGKILYCGVSNFSAWQTMKALGVADAIGAQRAVCTQPMYNLVKRQAEVEILPMALEEGIGVVPYSPLGAGLLTGKYGRNKAPSAGRLQSNTIYKARYGEEHVLDTADGLSALAEELGVHTVALAIAWVMAHPAVTAPLIGARNVGQLEGAFGALDIAVDGALWERISALTSAPPLATDRREEQVGLTYGGALK